MHDLPPLKSHSEQAETTDSSPPKFQWWKGVSIGLIGFAILLAWVQGNRQMVDSDPVAVIEKSVQLSPQAQNRLRAKFLQSPESLSDEEYRNAALIDERSLHRELQARHKRAYRNDVEPIDRWQKRINQLEKQLNGVTEAEEGTNEWSLLRQLEQTRAEKPAS